MIARRVLAASGWALAGALLFYLRRPAPSAPDYPTVIVHKELIERLEPDSTRHGIVDRVRYVMPAPTQRAIAPAAAITLVTTFCAPTVRVATGDTASAVPPRLLLLRSFSLDRGRPFRSDRLRVTGPTSDGDLVQQTYQTHGSVSARAVGDSVLVRYSRWWLVKEAVPFLLVGGIGYVAGAAR